MACPEPAMAVEARFLQQLAGVNKFGFMIGQLALSYEIDGNHGVMLFDASDPDGE
jgi:heat shock protein HslJ